MTDISRLRLNLLRACSLWLVLGLSLNFWPLVMSGAAALPLTEGVVNAILSAVGLLAILGLVAPLRMLPLLLFEIAWKLVWTISVALPNALAGTLDTAMAETLFACAWAVPFVFILPWKYIYTASRRP